MRGSSESLKELLRLPHVDPSQHRYGLPLIVSANYGHTEVVRSLLNYRFAPDQMCNAVNAATSAGNIECLRVLLQIPGIDLMANGGAALKIAAENGFDSCLLVLLEYVGEGIVSFDDQFCLRWAAMRGLLRSTRKLLSIPHVDPTVRDSEALRWAARFGQTECLKLLLQDGRSNVSALDNEGFRAAAKFGRRECMEVLLADSRVDPSANGNEAIVYAARYGHHLIVARLLELERVDMFANGFQAFVLAAKFGHGSVVELLLSRAKALNRVAEYATIVEATLRASCLSGRHTTVSAILRVEDVCPVSSQLLALAAGSGRYECVKVLLEDRRIDVTANNNRAVQVAKENGFTEVVKLLLSNKDISMAASLKHSSSLDSLTRENSVDNLSATGVGSDDSSD